MPDVHHKPLPGYSTLLSGRERSGTATRGWNTDCVASRLVTGRNSGRVEPLGDGCRELVRSVPTVLARCSADCHPPRWGAATTAPAGGASVRCGRAAFPTIRLGA